MAVFNEPSKWQTSLVNSGDANTIPQTTPAGSGKASFEKGFPQITQVPIGAGGIAPDRKDFNGLFKVLGDWVFFAQNGGVPTYNANFDYTVGRIVLYTDNNIYKCIYKNGPNTSVGVVPPPHGSYWKQILTTADLANFADIDLSNLSASGQAILDGKAKTDLSNLIDAGKIAIVHNITPSTSTKSLTVGASGTSYTAPADGYVSASQYTSSGSAQNVSLASNGVASKGFITSGTSQAFIPVGKGDSFILSYSGGGTITLNFIYAKGSESEA